MEYFVDYKLHNATNDGWAMKTTKHSTDLIAMKKEYHAQLSSYLGSDTFDKGVVSLSDENGTIYAMENFVNFVPVVEEVPSEEVAEEVTE